MYVETGALNVSSAGYSFVQRSNFLIPRSNDCICTQNCIRSWVVAQAACVFEAADSCSLQIPYTFVLCPGYTEAFQDIRFSERNTMVTAFQSSAEHILGPGCNFSSLRPILHFFDDANLCTSHGYRMGSWKGGSNWQLARISCLILHTQK